MVIYLHILYGGKAQLNGQILQHLVLGIINPLVVVIIDQIVMVIIMWIILAI